MRKITIVLRGADDRSSIIKDDLGAPGVLTPMLDSVGGALALGDIAGSVLGPVLEGALGDVLGLAQVSLRPWQRDGGQRGA